MAPVLLFGTHADMMSAQEAAAVCAKVSADVYVARAPCFVSSHCVRSSLAAVYYLSLSHTLPTLMHAVLRRQLHCAKHYNRNLKLCRLIISKLTNNILFCSVISKCPAVTRQISTRYSQIEQAMVEERNHRKLMFYVSCTKCL